MLKVTSVHGWKYTKTLPTSGHVISPTSFPSSATNKVWDPSKLSILWAWEHAEEKRVNESNFSDEIINIHLMSWKLQGFCCCRCFVSSPLFCQIRCKEDFFFLIICPVDETVFIFTYLSNWVFRVFFSHLLNLILICSHLASFFVSSNLTREISCSLCARVM